MTTVRDATFDVMRECGMTRVFANPGSTEIAFLTDLPDDLEFVLALHEGSVVGMATRHAIATGEPVFVNLHTTAGLGNAVGAIATVRVNRAIVIVPMDDWVAEVDPSLGLAAPAAVVRTRRPLARQSASAGNDHHSLS